MKKFFKILLIVLILGGVGFWVYIKFISPVSIKKAMTMIPNDAIMIIETNNLTDAWTKISDSKMWNYLIKNSYFNDLNEDIEYLNKYLKNNVIADQALKNRKLLMSLHMISGTEWDFLFVVDMKNIAQIKKLGLKEVLGLVEGYNVTEREYKGETIVELVDEADPSFIIYLTISDNLLVATFTGTLIEKSIDQKPVDKKDLGYWAKNKEFTFITNKLQGEELFRIYFNYNQLNTFSMSFLTESSETVAMLGNSLTYSSFNVDFQDEFLSLEGYTGIDSIGSYVKAMSHVTPGKMDAWRIMSGQTSLYFSLGFENFFDFYNNLLGQYEEGNSKDMEDINTGIKKLERLLGISIHDDFFSWIGNEIALAKMRPGKTTRLEDVIVAFHTKDIDTAKAGLDNIMKKIKNRIRVVKFEPEDYKNFTIYYFEMPGFFKLFLGKMFKDLEKPFFTYVEDFVVFSNSPQTLKYFIDDYISGNTLDKNVEFVNFKDEFDVKSNVTLFIRTPQIYENLYYYSSPEDRKAVMENKEFILSFEKIGFQLVSEGDLFKTTLLAIHNPNAVTTDILEVIEKEVTEEMFRDEVESKMFKLVLPESSLETDKLYKEYYGTTEIVKLEGQIYKNKPNGIWKSYYENGRIKSSVNYKDGLIEGEAFFYYDGDTKTMKAEAIFVQDNLEGIYTEYYDNGTQKANMNYEKGLAEGKAEFYYPNGKMKIEANFKEGTKDGRWVYYDEKGKEAGKEKWKKGERVK
jgi:hypothetical protein